MSYLGWFVLAALLTLAWSILLPHFTGSWFVPIERFGARLAKRKGLTLVAVGLAALLTRPALLRVLPVPVPQIHDEFSYMLQSDTFAHGRLTNPTHPMWIFFDTFHVLQKPTYASMYPPAQGAVLAFGQVLGHPWIGVVLSMAAMCVAVTWMLQGWFPAEWALLGGVLVFVRLDLFSTWAEGYFGGAVAAVGGALVIGAFPRILRHMRTRDAVAMAIGAALLANSRPFEGLLFCIPVAIGLLARLLSKQRPPVRVIGRCFCLPVVTILAATVVFMGYYDWRVTGNVFLHPHALYNRGYLNDPMFVWQTPGPALKYSNPQFEIFNVWREIPRHPWGHFAWKKCHDFCIFYLGNVLWAPFVTLPWLVLDRRIRFLWLQFSFCALGLFAVVWFSPHYAAALTAIVFALLVQAMRHLRRWEFRGRPVGIFLTRLVVLAMLLRVPIYIWRLPVDDRWGWSRARIADQLRSVPGEQLAIVRYSPDHNALHEWVYNTADIDHSTVVWAREIPGLDLKPLLEYFGNRKVWLVEADAIPVQLRPYESAPAPHQNSKSLP